VRSDFNPGGGDLEILISEKDRLRMKKKEEEEAKKLEALKDENLELDVYAKMIEKTIVVALSQEEEKINES